jgi:hypothetical protein
MHGAVRFAVLFAILLAFAIGAWWRTAEFARSPANRLQFEDLPPAEVTALDLRSEDAWSREEVYVDRLDA